MLDPRRLRHFVGVFEQRSLGRAAGLLHLTQPALSKSIHLLEEQLKVKLFNRTPLGVVPTVYGESLYLHAKVIESELRNAEREISMLSGATKGEIRVGVTPSIAANLMPATAKRLAAERPGIQLNVIEGLMHDHLAPLRRGELDAIVGGWTRGMNPDLRTEVIFRDQVRVFGRAHHPLHDRKADHALLREYPWVLPPHTQFWMDQFESSFVSRGLSPPVPIAVSNSASFVKGMLTETDCLSFLPRQLLLRDLEQGVLVQIDTGELEVQIDINVTMRERSAPPAALSAFIETLHSVCRSAV
jgi:DNA-binding transcriptional LysR family regulator